MSRCSLAFSRKGAHQPLQAVPLLLAFRLQTDGLVWDTRAHVVPSVSAHVLQRAFCDALCDVAPLCTQVDRLGSRSGVSAGSLRDQYSSITQPKIIEVTDTMINVQWEACAERFRLVVTSDPCCPRGLQRAATGTNIAEDCGPGARLEVDLSLSEPRVRLASLQPLTAYHFQLSAEGTEDSGLGFTVLTAPAVPPTPSGVNCL